MFIYLLPTGSLLHKLLPLLLSLLPGEEVPPWVAALVVEEEQCASKQVRDKSWESGQQQELIA